MTNIWKMNSSAHKVRDKGLKVGWLRLMSVSVNKQGVKWQKQTPLCTQFLKVLIVTSPKRLFLFAVLSIRTPDRVVRVRALAGVIVLCFSSPTCTNMGNSKYAGDNPAMH